MSKTLLAAFVAAIGLSTLAGCHHAQRQEAFTPVAETVAISPAGAHQGKWR